MNCYNLFPLFSERAEEKRKRALNVMYCLDGGKEIRGRRKEPIGYVRGDRS